MILLVSSKKAKLIKKAVKNLMIVCIDSTKAAMKGEISDDEATKNAATAAGVLYLALGFDIDW